MTKVRLAVFILIFSVLSMFKESEQLFAAPKISLKPAPRSTYVPQFPACGPETEHAPDVRRKGDPSSEPLPTLDFCADWNPEFGFNGQHCCGKTGAEARSRKKARCSPQRFRQDYCREITQEQKEYFEKAKNDKLGDILKLIEDDLGRKGNQAYCTENNGFLVHGRPLLPSVVNRIALRKPEKCTEYGTDSMIAMLEWLGRMIVKDFPNPEYAKTRLVIGDISAPRGGCLSGVGGRRGHLSHANGQDVDIGFLVAKPEKASPIELHRHFDVQENWKLLKHLLNNPYACIKVVFLDKKIIRKLSKAVRSDEEWLRHQRFIRHSPHHRNHFHVRVGSGPGPVGCVADAKPELEMDEYDEGPEVDGETENDEERFNLDLKS